MSIEARAAGIEILLRGSHNHALDKAARAICETLGKCMKREALTTSHHPDCDALRAAVRKLKVHQ